MSARVILDSTVPPAAVLEALAAFGTDWRESRLPPSARTAGIYECVVEVSGSSFELRLASQGSGPYLKWRGVVTSGGQDGTTSRIEVRAGETGASRALAITMLAFVTVWWAWPQLQPATADLASVVFAVGGVAAGVFFYAGLLSWQADRQGRVIRAVLAQLVGSPRSASPSAPAPAA